MLRLALLLAPAAFFTTTLAFSFSLCLRLSCLSAALEGFSFTLARPALLSLNDFFAIVLTRAALMFAVSVTLPLLPASPFTTIVMTPFRLTFTLRTRGLPGLGGLAVGFGMASAWSIERPASAAPPETVTPCR